jgi:hypothetical protein
MKYVAYTRTGGGVRHHHFGIQNNIINEADGKAVAGDVINALGFASLPLNGNNLPFAFMSVHGAADGNHLYTSPGNQTVPVGNSNIDILAIYAPAGGIGSGGGPGVWVDAFNVDTGSFSDSDFVQVLTPPTPPDTVDNPKTSRANMEGDVSTIAAENVSAFASVDGVPFLEWKEILPSTAVMTPREVDLSKDETAIMFAFYQSIPLEILIPYETARVVQGIRKFREDFVQFLPHWIQDDWCGTPWPHPRHIGPAGPNLQLSIKVDIINSLKPSQREKLQSYMKDYSVLARESYGQMGRLSAMLNEVSELLSAGRQR